MPRVEEAADEDQKYYEGSFRFISAECETAGENEREQDRIAITDEIHYDTVKRNRRCRTLLLSLMMSLKQSRWTRPGYFSAQVKAACWFRHRPSCSAPVATVPPVSWCAHKPTTDYEQRATHRSEMELLAMNAKDFTPRPSRKQVQSTRPAEARQR